MSVGKGVTVLGPLLAALVASCALAPATPPEQKAVAPPAAAPAEVKVQPEVDKVPEAPAAKAPPAPEEGLAPAGPAEPIDEGEALIQRYSLPYDTVWQAVHRALASMHLSVSGDNKAEGFVLAERGRTVGAWGEKVIVFIETLEGGDISVKVISKPDPAVKGTQQDWGPLLLEGIRQELTTERCC